MNLYCIFLNLFTKLSVLVLCCLLSLAGGCSSAPEKARPPDYDVFWGAEEDGLALKFSGAADLNLDRGRPSSLSICLYQLSDSRGFAQLRQTPPGLAQLAACQEKFDQTVLGFNRLFLEPGQNLETFLDRLEGTKYVGLVAGYYHLQSDRCTRLAAVPIITVSDGWFSGSHREPSQLVLELKFGPSWPEGK